MTRKSQSVVIVGASAAGAATADRLRERSFEGTITLLGEELHAPYDRPPLSKQLLAGEWEPTRLQLRNANHFAENAIDVRLGAKAVGLDSRAKTIALSDGMEVPYDDLVIATGLTTRQLPAATGLAGVHVLRTLDDGIALRAACLSAQHVVIIGGGFVGSEAASVLRASGVAVTIVSARPHLMQRQLGVEVASALTTAHRASGTEVLGGPSSEVSAIENHAGQVVGVRLRDGRRIPADVVLLGIGANPAVDWVRGSGVPVGDGVLCSADCSAAPSVFAAGDVARWNNERFALSMRLEHRTNAVDQGRHVADRIVDQDHLSYTPLPYFWSDQLGMKLQAHGVLQGHDEVRIVEGSIGERRLVALYRRGDKLIGVLGIGAIKAVRSWRAAVAEGAAWKDVVPSVS